MRDITCTNPSCGKIIQYKQYCRELRAVQFDGIHCSYCGSEQALEYQIIAGTGRRIKIKYEPPGNTKKSKIQFYVSCESCYSFWEDKEQQYCPFCGRYLDNKHIEEYRIVPGVKVVPKEFAAEQKMMQLKVDFVDCGGKINLLDFGKEHSEYLSLKLEAEQKNILCKLSELAVDLRT